MDRGHGILEDKKRLFVTGTHHSCLLLDAAKDTKSSDLGKARTDGQYRSQMPSQQGTVPGIEDLYQTRNGMEMS